jgi:hypothetical protein
MRSGTSRLFSHFLANGGDEKGIFSSKKEMFRYLFVQADEEKRELQEEEQR